MSFSCQFCFILSRIKKTRVKSFLRWMFYLYIYSLIPINKRLSVLKFVCLAIEREEKHWTGWYLCDLLVCTAAWYIIVSFCSLGIKPYLDDKERWNIHLNCICVTGGTLVRQGHRKPCHNMHHIELLSQTKIMKVNIWNNTFCLRETLLRC